MKQISVVIPHKGRISHLKQALDGLVHQNLPEMDYEIIVGSLDCPEEMVAIVREYPSVKFLC